MQSELIIPFLTYAVVTTFTPGPNNITSTSAGILLGYRNSLPYLLGIASGFFGIMFISGVLTNIIASKFESALNIIKWFGAAYIIYLAVAPFIHYGKGKKKSNYAYSFWSGLSLQIVNPKAMLYGATVYSSFGQLLLTSYISVIVSAIFLALLSFSSISVWNYIGSTLSRYFENKKFYYIFNGVLAFMLGYIAIKIVMI